MLVSLARTRSILVIYGFIIFRRLCQLLASPTARRHQNSSEFQKIATLQVVTLSPSEFYGFVTFGLATFLALQRFMNHFCSTC